MKIAYFVDAYFPTIDGVVTIIHNYCKELSKENEVVVFCPTKIKKIKEKIPYRIVPCSYLKFHNSDYPVPFPWFNRGFWKVIKKEKFDVIHVHSPFILGKIGFKKAKKDGVISIFTLHSKYKEDFEQRIKFKPLVNLMMKNVRKTISMSDVFWTPNQGSLEYANNFFKSSHHVVKPQKSATDLTSLQISKSEAKKYVENKWNIKIKENVFLVVARITNQKNLYFLIDSMNKYKEVVSDNFTLLIAGTGSEESKLKKYVSKLKLNENIIFLGNIDDRNDLSHLYKSANLYLFPSLYDTGSLTMRESASQELSCLFIKGSTTSFGVKDNINGFLAENDVDKFANRINEILSNQELLKKVNNQAKQDFYTSWSDASTDVLKQYKELSSKN